MKSTQHSLLVSLIAMALILSLTGCEPGPRPAAALDFELVFELGTPGPYGNVYAAWIESGAYLQNVILCEKIATQSLTGVVLPYWSINKRPLSTDISLDKDGNGDYIDGITAASVASADFTKYFSLRDQGIRQFTLYFEFDNSAVYNDWFVKTTDDLPGYYVFDQPAILYAVDVDLDDTSKTEYELELVAWTPNGHTPRIFTPMTDGVPETETRYITHHKTASDDFGEEYNEANSSATDRSMAGIVKKITLRIK